MIKELICISCPLGCLLKVEIADKIIVSGNKCSRGIKYAIEEITEPKRIITSIVPVIGGDIAMLSVKTDKALPKALINEALHTLKDLNLHAPIAIHQIVVDNILGTNINFIATKSINKV